MRSQANKKLQCSQADFPEDNLLEARKSVLSWYDRYARILPWRAPLGIRQDPYLVWLSEIMLQQTTVPAVKPYFEKFIRLWPDIHSLANADLDRVLAEWAGLGYYARARNLHKCAGHVSREMDGVFPETPGELKQLPGVGDYTAAAIASIAFDYPVLALDGNVERVLSRLFMVTEPLPAAKKQIKNHARAFEHTDRPGDFTQAMMDLGATICTPKKPKCDMCPSRSNCLAYKNDVAETLPKKSPKNTIPARTGTLYWVYSERGDQILMERRPEKGLLGGMMAFPSHGWSNDKDNVFLTMIDSEKTGLEVRHVFTHFKLSLCIEQAILPENINLPENYFWYDLDKIAEIGLPSLFQKAAKLLESSREE